MIDVNKLKGAIVSAGKIQNEVAKALGITPKTFFFFETKYKFLIIFLYFLKCS